MASSSLSQEDFEADYETSARRTRVRTARARNVNSAAVVRGMEADNDDSNTAPVGLDGQAPEHDASPKPSAARAKDKRTRANHTNKGKQQRDRRKLREKRRSTGVVHLPSTESTGGSTGEDEDELVSLSVETKRNTMFNEVIDKENNIYSQASQERLPKSFSSRRNKSPSDLEADDEDNQDYDSTVNQSNSNASLAQEALSSPSWLRVSNGRPQTPSSENLEELLERAREENRHLLELLENKDQKIFKLEKEVAKLNRALQVADSESEKLKDENKALIRAMAQLAVK